MVVLLFPLCSLQTAYTIPILAFAFVCHPEVLPIYTELRKWVNLCWSSMFVTTSLLNIAVIQPSDFSPSKAKMQKVSNISIFVMYIMYFLAALFGYLTFKGKSMFFLLKLCYVCMYYVYCNKLNQKSGFQVNQNYNLNSLGYLHKQCFYDLLQSQLILLASSTFHWFHLISAPCCVGV